MITEKITYNSLLERFDFWQEIKNLGESKKEKIFENLKI